VGDYIGMEEQYGGQQEDFQWGYISMEEQYDVQGATGQMLHRRNLLQLPLGLICKLGGYGRAIVYERGRHCNLGHICKLGGYWQGNSVISII